MTMDYISDFFAALFFIGLLCFIVGGGWMIFAQFGLAKGLLVFGANLMILCAILGLFAMGSGSSDVPP